MLQVMIQNIDMRVQMQDYNPIIAHKSDSFFFLFYRKAAKNPLKQLLSTSYLRNYRNRLKDEENLKNDKRYLTQICMSKTVKENT